MALIKSAVTPPEWAVPAQSPRRGGLCPRAVGGGGLPGSLLVFRGTGRFSRFPWNPRPRPHHLEHRHLGLLDQFQLLILRDSALGVWNPLLLGP